MNVHIKIYLYTFVCGISFGTLKDKYLGTGGYILKITNPRPSIEKKTSRRKKVAPRHDQNSFTGAVSPRAPWI